MLETTCFGGKPDMIIKLQEQLSVCSEYNYLLFAYFMIISAKMKCSRWIWKNWTGEEDVR